MQKILLTCDVCGKTIDQRLKTNERTKDPNGDPAEIGGLKGIVFEEGYKVIDMDFCQEHWKNILENLKTLKELNKE